MARSVSFLAAVSATHDVLHVSDYSDDEKEACWYNDREKQMINVEIRNTITIMNLKHDAINSEFFCTRGLEDSDASDFAHGVALDAVLDEQELQWNRGLVDPDQLAKIYSEKTEVSKTLAALMGRADQEWVEKERAKQEHLSRNGTARDDDPKSRFVLRPCTVKAAHVKPDCLRKSRAGCGAC